MLLLLRFYLPFFVVLAQDEINFPKTDPEISCGNLCGAHLDLKILVDVYQIATTYSTDIDQFRKVHSMVERVRVLQGKNEFLERSEDEKHSKIPELMEWCHNRLKHLAVKVFPEYGLGLEIVDDVTTNETLTSINIRDTLHLIDALHTFENQKELYGLLKPKTVKYRVLWNRHSWLALKIISEHLKGRKSKHYLHIQNLPTSFNMILYFNPYEVSLLDGSPAYKDAIQSVYEVVRQYIVIYKHLLSNPDGLLEFGITPDIFTFDYYRWAWTCVLTRGYEDSYNHLIIPCWDMVNHGEGQMDMKIKYTFDKNKQYGSEGEIYSWATEDLKKGNQLFHEYNELHATMDHFFTTWGMVEPRGSFTIGTELETDDPLYKYKYDTLYKEFGWSSNDHYVTILGGNEKVIADADFPMIQVAGTGLHPNDALNQTTWSQLWNYLIEKIESTLILYKIDPDTAQHFLDTKADLTKNGRLALVEIITEQEFLKSSIKRIRNIAKGEIVKYDWETALNEPNDDYFDEPQHVMSVLKVHDEL